MSEGNSKLLAAGLAALNARDLEGLDAVAHEEVEWRPALTAGGHLEGAVYRGKSGMHQYLDDLDAAFDETEFKVERIEEVDPNRILYRGRVKARGKASGIPLDAQVWGLWEVRDGKLFRGVAFLTKEEALKAAGLSE